MPECYVTERLYQLKCDKPLGRRLGLKIAIFSFVLFE